MFEQPHHIWENEERYENTCEVKNLTLPPFADVVQLVRAPL